MSNAQETAGTRGIARYWAVGAALMSVSLAAGVAFAGGRQARECTGTALDQLHACVAEVRDDTFTARAKCRNVLDDDERGECFKESWDVWREGYPLCREQFNARRGLCGQIGEGRYDPEFEPGLFDDPRAPTKPNPFFPLSVGNRWVYEGGDETITVQVLDKTKLIDGVTCLVVHDRVDVDGKPLEDTDDWFGIRKDGSVAYCGEISGEFEIFEGDDPEEAELVDIEGSWKAGRDGALAGTVFLAEPAEGKVYRQEWSAGDAEDAAKVVSTSYRFGDKPELDAHVPQQLAELMCGAADCVVTGEFSPISPDVFELKYYARGVGLFLEVDPEAGETTELVECNLDAKCGSLP